MSYAVSGGRTAPTKRKGDRDMNPHDRCETCLYNVDAHRTNEASVHGRKLGPVNRSGEGLSRPQRLSAVAAA